jgi:hypothetical protein
MLNGTQLLSSRPYNFVKFLPFARLNIGHVTQLIDLVDPKAGKAFGETTTNRPPADARDRNAALPRHP